MESPSSVCRHKNDVLYFVDASPLFVETFEMRLLVLLITITLSPLFTSSIAWGQSAFNHPWGFYAEYSPIIKPMVVTALNKFVAFKGGTPITTTKGFSGGMMLVFDGENELQFGASSASGKGTIVKTTGSAAEAFSYSVFSMDFFWDFGITSEPDGAGFQLFVPVGLNLAFDSANILADSSQIYGFSALVSAGFKLRTFITGHLMIDTTALIHLDPIQTFAGTDWANVDGGTTPTGQPTVSPNLTAWEVKAGLVYTFF